MAIAVLAVIVSSAHAAAALADEASPVRRPGGVALASCPYQFGTEMPSATFCVYRGIALGSRGEVCATDVVVIWSSFGPPVDACDAGVAAVPARRSDECRTPPKCVESERRRVSGIRRRSGPRAAGEQTFRRGPPRRNGRVHGGEQRGSTGVGGRHNAAHGAPGIERSGRCAQHHTARATNIAAGGLRSGFVFRRVRGGHWTPDRDRNVPAIEASPYPALLNSRCAVTMRFCPNCDRVRGPHFHRRCPCGAMGECPAGLAAVQPYSATARPRASTRVDVRRRFVGPVDYSLPPHSRRRASRDRTQTGRRRLRE